MATRRSFLKRMAQVGGARAVYLSMQGLGLTPARAAASPLPALPPTSGSGTSVVVLGAGVAGLVSAWELTRAGYTVTVLEARTRPGGRNWSVRGGTKVEFTDGTVQTCEYTNGRYLNAGPARIPSIHHALLGYCRELGVALEVEVNMSRSARLQNDEAFGGRPVELRQAVNDTRGWLSDLLAKAVNRHALDDELTAADRDRLIAFLRGYGDLSGDLSFKGTGRSGFAVEPGAASQAARRKEPLPLSDLLHSDFVGQMLFDESLDMQATMFQPVGGMDRIPYAFAERLEGVIRFGAIVTELRKTDHGVRIVYAEGTGSREAVADYCVCTMPPPQLARLPHDLSATFGKAVADIRYASAYKIGWESRRFWEQDLGIYGGISFLRNHPVGVIWYPSDRMHSDRGVIVSGYSGETGSAMAAIPTIEGRLAASRDAVEKVHPGHGKELETPVFVSWGRVPFSEGSWVNRGLGPDGTPYYEGPYLQLQQPDDRIYFAGDYLAQVGAWQEGAVLSAQRAVALIAKRQRQTTVAR